MDYKSKGGKCHQAPLPKVFMTKLGKFAGEGAGVGKGSVAEPGHMYGTHAGKGKN